MNLIEVPIIMYRRQRLRLRRKKLKILKVLIPVLDDLVDDWFWYKVDFNRMLTKNDFVLDEDEWISSVWEFEFKYWEIRLGYLLCSFMVLVCIIFGYYYYVSDYAMLDSYL